jgi:hypothetical protein
MSKEIRPTCVIAAGVREPYEEMQILATHSFRPVDEHDWIPLIALGVWMRVARTNANTLRERWGHAAGPEDRLEPRSAIEALSGASDDQF